MKKLIVLLILFFAKSSFSAELAGELDFSEATPIVGNLDQLPSTSQSSDSDFTCPFGSFDSDTTQTFNFPADTPDTAENVDSTKEPEKVQKETKEQTEQKLDREKKIIATAVLAKDKKKDSQYKPIKRITQKKQAKKEKAKRDTLFKPEEWGEKMADGRIEHKKCKTITDFSNRSKHAKTCNRKKRYSSKQVYHDEQWTTENGKSKTTKHKICGREMVKRQRSMHEKSCDGVNWISVTQQIYKHVPCNQKVYSNFKERHLEECKI